ncbi:MAG: hypothetical protein HZA59_05900 [Hydrogenophilales bacterium]|nr:hypothetical protein [Hydrogenophilales bacterium]
MSYFRFLGLCCALVFGGHAAAQELRLTMDDIQSPTFDLKGIEARLALAPRTTLDLTIAQATLQGHVWQRLAIHCPDAFVEADRIECRRGWLEMGERLPLAFVYRPRARSLSITLSPETNERWQAQLDWRQGPLTAKLEVKNGKTTRLNPWLPEHSPRLSQGVFDLSGKWEAARRLDLSAAVRNAAFSDAAGTRAGEKLAGNLALHAEQRDEWRWQASAVWREGEVFWQPFYLPAAARTVSASGTLNAQWLKIAQASAQLAGIGDIAFSATWDRARGRLDQMQAEARDLALAGLYSSLLKPLLGDGVLGKLAVSGSASGALEVKDARLAQLRMTVQDGAARHEAGLFALAGVNADAAWDRILPTQARVQAGSGELRGLPLGGFHLQATLSPDRVQIEPVVVPILDGALALDGVVATHHAGQWAWEMSGALRPISMERFTRMLKWPVMHGALSGVIPKVSYANQGLRVEGALLFRLFDGTAVMKDVRVADLLGLAPRVQANIEMRNLDLDLLTRAFSFGSMQGRLDVDVNDLELANWRPVRFDARVASSPGDYLRKISQRAVQNISSIGGAGGGAAIQASFLRFFDQFGYQRIGLSCRLARDVCEMDGIEAAPHGYVIVKGGGIPALSVIGYNRRVGWNELLTRIGRVMQGNKPIVQ